MNSAKRFLTIAATFALAAVVLTMANPGAVHAFVATLVQVTNTTANPVMIQDVNNGARQAIQLQVNPTTPTTGFFTGNFTTVNGGDYIVPAGKRFVIRSVTSQVVLPTGSKPAAFWIATKTANGEEYDQLLPSFVFQISSQGRDFFQMNSDFTGYSDGGFPIGVLFSSTAGTGTTNIYFTLNGYLVDCDNNGCPAQP